MEITCRLTFGSTTPRQFLTAEMDLTVLGSPTEVRTLSVVKRVPGEPPPMLWFADSRDPLPVKWPSILPHLIKHPRKSCSVPKREGSSLTFMSSVEAALHR